MLAEKLPAFDESAIGGKIGGASPGGPMEEAKVDAVASGVGVRAPDRSLSSSCKSTTEDDDDDAAECTPVSEMIAEC